MKKILLITPKSPYGEARGNSMRIKAIVESLQSFGHEVFVLHVSRDSNGICEKSQQKFGEHYIFQPFLSFFSRAHAKFHRICFRFGLPVLPFHVDSWYSKKLETLTADLHKKHDFDTVICEYIYTSKAFNALPKGVNKVIDTHDIYAERAKLFKANNATTGNFYTTRTQEKKALDRANTVIGIQEKETEYFDSLSSATALTIGHIIKADEVITEDSRKICFVGTEIDPNVKGLEWFLKKVWPLVREQNSEVHLLIAGKVCMKFEERSIDGVSWCGFVDDLNDIYQDSAVAISPVAFGTGLKIKSIEALSKGLPLVSTTVGAIGIEQAAESEALTIADESDAFAKRLLEIMNQPELRKTAQKDATKFVDQYYQKNLDKLKQIV